MKQNLILPFEMHIHCDGNQHFISAHKNYLWKFYALIVRIMAITSAKLDFSMYYANEDFKLYSNRL